MADWPDYRGRSEMGRSLRWGFAVSMALPVFQPVFRSAHPSESVLKNRNALHAVVALIGVWLVAKGIAGLLGYDLDSVFNGILW